MEINKKQAYLEFNLAPLQLRRDIAMLGVLYKVCHGTAHVDFDLLFPKALTSAEHGHGTRASRRRHDMQLVDLWDGTQLGQFQRSLFGLVKVWNALPSAFVHATSVSSFQSMLNRASKQACVACADGWQSMFATTSRPFSLLTK